MAARSRDHESGTGLLSSYGLRGCGRGEYPGRELGVGQEGYII